MNAWSHKTYVLNLDQEADRVRGLDCRDIHVSFLKVM
jgi:hypothetical protein